MATILNKDLSDEELGLLFASDEKCLELLASMKWEEGFVCRKCGNENWCPGKSPSSRRCTRCKMEESASAATVFHNCKFPVSKAFYIAWHVCKKRENISSYEFARRLSLRQMTCWNFKKKISVALDNLQTLTEAEKNSIQQLLGS